MKNASVASMITVSEETRRMQDMMKMYSMGGMDMSAFGATGETLVLNANHPLVKYVLENKDGKIQPRSANSCMIWQAWHMASCHRSV